MATLNLGRIKPVFRGAYAGGTAYVVDDIVTSGNETFICIQASTGNATSNASYWTKLAAKGADGTNGTDVSTTLTTDGDVLYKGSGALQRLAKGTAGQALKMNAGATAPEWGTISSDFVKLATGEVTSDASYMEVNGYFDDSVYQCYKIYVNDVRWQTGGGQVNWRWTTSAGTTNNSNDYFILDGSYYTTSNGNRGYQNRSHWNTSSIDDFEGTWSNRHSSSTSTTKESMEGTIWTPSAGYVQMSYQYNTLNDSGSSTVVMAVSNGFHGSNNSTAKTGFQLLKSSGTNIRTAKWALYGIKK